MGHNTTQELIIDALAAVRLARLITTDDSIPVLAMRQRITDNPNTGDVLREFIECRWCVSFWCGLAVWASRRAAPRLWAPIGFALASSQLAGMLIT